MGRSGGLSRWVNYLPYASALVEFGVAFGRPYLGNVACVLGLLLYALIGFKKFRKFGNFFIRYLGMLLANGLECGSIPRSSFVLGGINAPSCRRFGGASAVRVMAWWMSCYASATIVVGAIEAIEPTTVKSYTAPFAPWL